MTLAEHFRCGGEVARSVRWYREGAEQALRASDLAGAISRADLALEAMGSEAGGETAGALHLVAGEAHLWRGEFPQAEVRGTQALSCLPARSAPWYRAVAETVIAVGKQGKVEALSAWAEQAAAQPPQDLAAGSAFVICLAWSTTFLLVAGMQKEADGLMAQIEALAAGGIGPDARALVHQARATGASLRGDLDGCLAALSDALAGFEEAGDTRNMAAVRANIGFMYAELGLLERGEAMLAQALAEAERIGLAELPAIVQHNLGRVRARRGDLSGGERLERAALASFVQQGEPRLEGLARTYLSEIALLAGDPAEAETQAVTALALLKVAPSARVLAMAALARAYLVQRRKADALAVARQAAAQLDELGTVDEGEAEVRLVHAETLAASGHADEAREAIRQARARLLERTERISDPEHRRCFLAEIPAHARTVELSQHWEIPAERPERAATDAAPHRPAI
jgi:tetratricopeptide (TPR) repeat protein